MNGIEAVDLKVLQAPSRLDEIEWRIERSGSTGKGPWAIIVPYFTARGVMDRLDAACGPGGWKVKFKGGPGGAILAKISILVPHLLKPHDLNSGFHEWVTKEDGTGPLENKQGLATDDVVKGELSTAFKRAGVMWGIGRDLYAYPVTFATITDATTAGAERAKLKDGTEFYWAPPAILPSTQKTGAAVPVPVSKPNPDSPIPIRAPENATAPAPATNPVTRVAHASKPPGKPTLDTPVTFGKHKGKPIRALDTSYLEWLVQAWNANPRDDLAPWADLAQDELMERAARINQQNREGHAQPAEDETYGI